jgi:hypothetical protein
MSKRFPRSCCKEINQLRRVCISAPNFYFGLICIGILPFPTTAALFADYTTIGLKYPRVWLWCGRDLQSSASYKGHAAECSNGNVAIKMEAKGLPVAWILPVGDTSQRLLVAVITQSVQAACVALLLSAILLAR